MKKIVLLFIVLCMTTTLFADEANGKSTFDNRASADGYINQTTLGIGQPVSHTFRLGAETTLSAETTRVKNKIPNRNMMRIFNLLLAILFALATTTKVRAQENDSVMMKHDTIQWKKDNPYRFRVVQLAIPAALIGVGIIGLESDWLKYQNHEIRNELQESIDSKLTIDDFSQYVPMAAVYGLNLCGIKGKHNFADRTVILATAYALMGVTVNGLKSITRVERPDGSSRNSFPSGHTATAFMGAEFLRTEYKDVSPWIGIAGYAVATGTGFFRMYNNRHWLTDVLAGAGIGILSTRAAYWLYPTISKAVFPKQYRKNVFLSPYVSAHEGGVYGSIHF